MSKFVLGAALAGFVAVGGCATVGGVSTISTSAVQADAVAICNWEPAASDIAAVIASLAGAASAAVVTANTAATAICNAVKTSTASAKFGTKLGAAPLPGAVYVAGVLVHRQQ